MNARQPTALRMNKTQLVEAVAEQADLSKAKSAAAVDSIVRAITETLSSGDDVALVGFGTFLVRQRPARTGRNPKTGERIEIAAANVPSFKAGKGLKEACN